MFVWSVKALWWNRGQLYCKDGRATGDTIEVADVPRIQPIQYFYLLEGFSAGVQHPMDVRQRRVVVHPHFHEKPSRHGLIARTCMSRSSPVNQNGKLNSYCEAMIHYLLKDRINERQKQYLRQRVRSYRARKVYISSATCKACTVSCRIQSDKLIPKFEHLSKPERGSMCNAQTPCLQHYERQVHPKRSQVGKIRGRWDFYATSVTEHIQNISCASN